jgi:Trehalose utilisation/Transposase
VPSPIRVTVWGENFHERSEHDRAAMAERYPRGMHGAIAAGLSELLGDSVVVSTVTQDQPEHGLSEEVLARTDVLTWWGHATHAGVDDAIVDRVQRSVLGGMGLLVLHSGHFSKIFRRLMGTTCSLAWRNSGDTELVWTVNPSHPITAGIPQPIIIDRHERRWAVENARGLGRHLAQWLVARGEVVDDVPSTAAARVRELSRGGRRKNDVIDAAAAASVAALQGEANPVLTEDLTTVLALLDERRNNVVTQRTRLVNQLHALSGSSCPAVPRPA